MRLKKLGGYSTKKLDEVGIKPGMDLYVTAPKADRSDE